MRIALDASRCVGHGICEAGLPDVFEVTDDGYAEIDDEAAAHAPAADLRNAALNCPSAALTVED
ncbi:ferredoxin [Gordonia sp. LSe1-13]|uniref:Ferredoxin n=1 Tax=Gordonia sesuvii TaxID=3116777 RepID=A0ABU7MAN1_9ACTN|nr:ferredoxin [Gordonia sp. LSe1-13]